MIKTQEEYINACNFIDSDLELYDFQLSEKMTSYEYNLYLQDTEYFLNFLYEKIRTLEELCDYLDDYIDTKIRSAKEHISRTTALLEHSIDSYLNGDICVIDPEWNQNTSSGLTDRDGRQIPVAELNTDWIGAAAQYTNEVKPQRYKTIDETLYSKEESVTEGRCLLSTQSNSGEEAADTKEATVHIFIPPTASWNHIKATPVNCELSFTKTQDGVTVTMISNGYDKEYRPFSYDPYTGSALNTIPEPDIAYQTERTIASNRRVLYDTREDRANQDYMHDVEQHQTTQAKNRSKARIFKAS